MVSSEFHDLSTPLKFARSRFKVSHLCWIFTEDSKHPAAHGALNFFETFTAPQTPTLSLLRAVSSSKYQDPRAEHPPVKIFWLRRQIISQVLNCKRGEPSDPLHLESAQLYSLAGKGERRRRRRNSFELYRFQLPSFPGLASLRLPAGKFHRDCVAARKGERVSD